MKPAKAQPELGSNEPAPPSGVQVRFLYKESGHVRAHPPDPHPLEHRPVPPPLETPVEVPLRTPRRAASAPLSPTERRIVERVKRSEWTEMAIPDSDAEGERCDPEAGEDG